jgi:DNA-3-methyladenine glycosylase
LSTQTGVTLPFSPLPRSFYIEPTTQVAQGLLGHYLVRKTERGLCAGIIVETEAYLSDDPACHAYLRETPRNRSMWGEPGMAYVYRIYGSYMCFNAVCRQKGVAEAVLVRAIEPTLGLDVMRHYRNTQRDINLTSGPSKLCVAMSIDLTLDGVDICDVASPLFIGCNPDIEETHRVLAPAVTTTRIGITRAADWPLRFYLDGSRYVSKRIARRAKLASE